MPKTRFQGIVFAALMVAIMVYTLTLYNVALEPGLTYAAFLAALKGMWGRSCRSGSAGAKAVPDDLRGEAGYDGSVGGPLGGH